MTHMRTRALVLLLAVGFGATTARADDAPTPTPADPPTTDPTPTPTPTATPAPAPTPAAATTLVGKVTDVLGKPIPRARIYVLPQGGGTLRLQTETDADGKYTVEVPGGALGVVIAFGKVHTYRQVIATDRKATTLDVEVEMDLASGGEVIRIIDRQLPPPAVPPKPQVDQRISLPYSDEAVERDAWARAWLLLDVDTTGTVTRLKLLKRPGFDLDQIAVDEGFKLEFEPALDAAGKPVRTYVVWTMEWPSWGWLVTGNGTAAGRPNDHDLLRPTRRNTSGVVGSSSTNVAVGARSAEDGSSQHDFDAAQALARGDLAGRPWARPLVVAPPKSLSSVPCAGSGPLNLDLRNRAYRDCSPAPDPKQADGLPWITRENAPTALAELARTTPRWVKGPRGSRLPELIATGVTGTLLVGAVYSYLQWDKYFDRVSSAAQRSPGAEQHEENRAAMNRYKSLTLGLAGGLVVSGAVTAFLWSRGQTREQFSVQPPRGGGAVSWGRAF